MQREERVPKGGPVNKLVVRWEEPGRVIYDTDGGIEVVVDGDETRRRLARRVVDGLDGISGRATHLLASLMRDSGTFDLASVEVFPNNSIDGGDFSPRFTFTADHEPRQYDEYGYTYFDVYFRHRQPPEPQFRPYKFTVGFH